MCTESDNGVEESIYLRICQLFSDYLRRKVQLGAVLSAADVVDTWIRYRAYLSYIGGICSYIDRFYVNRYAKPSLKLAALETFQITVFGKHKEGLKAELLRQLDAMRSTMEADELRIGAITEMYKELDGTGGLQYMEELEEDIVKQAKTYYSTMAPIWVTDLDLIDYVSIVEHCMEQEKTICSKWLKNSTEILIKEAISYTMLVSQQDTIISKMDAVEQFVKTSKEEDLELLYKVLKGLDKCLYKMADILKACIQGSYSSITTFKHLLQVWIKYKGLLKKCFSDEKEVINQCDVGSAEGSQGFDNSEPCVTSSHESPKYNPVIAAAIKDAFKGIISKNNDFIKQLVNHWDEVIVRGDAECHAELLDCCEILELTDNRSLFFHCYKFKLASRLLYSRSAQYMENMSLSMLEERSSSEDTSCLKRMTKEIYTKGGDNALPMIRQISKNNWPHLKDYRDHIKLNEEFENVLTLFEKSQNEHIHRKIEYNRMLGRVEMELMDGHRSKSLTCDLVQASALLLFQENTLDAGYMADKLNIPVGTLMYILQPLLEKDGENMIKLNTEFEDYIDVTVNAVPDYSDSRKSTEDGMTRQRHITNKHAVNLVEEATRIDLRVVSIVKSAKNVKLDELLLQLSTFPREEVLKRIDHLCQKEYMRKTDDAISYVP
ncbi:cullin like protein [Babesia gibsoni]|uniref:Cullin like protein n=1 Tax=Babesia gibsoni TaxID=33632 RepID=A0AAD8PFV6_BABGI|nr:cullin like protein [Babesia gibsoni]